MPTDKSKRTHPRIKPKQTVRVEYPDFVPRVRNLSISGAFIEDARPLPRGRIVPLRLWLGYKEPVTMKAMVRRVEEGRGMGVEFLSMEEGDRKRLREFVGAAPSMES